MVSVNLSAREFDRGDLRSRVARVLAESGLPARHLTLEVTETSLLRGSRTLVPEFEGLKSLGVQLAIDDFGTGYSSLTHLQHFPFDILKIDKSFLREVRQNPRDSSLLSGIIHLATGLQLQVIAEGVEHAEQVDLLRRLGCSFGQGYHFARPLPPTEIEHQLASW